VVAAPNLGAATSSPRSVNSMPRHRITTASLLQAIEDQRAEEASSRWEELSREFMSEASDADSSDSDRTDAAA
jgi:hypothetical protein